MFQTFGRYAHDYDQWFDTYSWVYRSEITAIKNFIPPMGIGVEIGVGTGRFASTLGIETGLEPARGMAEIAKRRGVEVLQGLAERAPFKEGCFDLVLMATTICFLQDPLKAIREAKRILKPKGYIVMGMIPLDSFLGQTYESKKKESKFYRYANFHTVDEVILWLKESGFDNIKTCQTIFKPLREIKSLEPVKDGYGEGGFVVVQASRQHSKSEV